MGIYWMLLPLMLSGWCCDWDLPTGDIFYMCCDVDLLSHVIFTMCCDEHLLSGVIIFTVCCARKCLVGALMGILWVFVMKILWVLLQETEHKQGHTLRVFRQKINVEVVKHIADLYIVEHCGGETVTYHWVMEVTEEGRTCQGGCLLWHAARNV